MAPVPKLSPRRRRFGPCIAGLIILSATIACANESVLIYQGAERAGSLRVERILPDADGTVVVPTNSVTIKTKTGAKQLVRVRSGRCEDVFRELLFRSGNPETPRLVVETNDQSYYSVFLLDYTFAPTMKTVAEVADKLGLEIVHERRRKLAFVIRANDEKRTHIERFQGQPKWPEARQPRKLNALGLPELSYGKLVPHEIKKFPKGGILFIRWKFDDDNSVAKDDNLYFDGVSFDELAQYFEEKRAFPAVNQTKDKLLYSFTLPSGIEKQFTFNKTVALPGLGLSVTSDEVEMEAIVVRDKRADKGAEKAANRSSNDTKKPPE